MEPKEIPCQVCIRTIAKKPGVKDNNFQVRICSVLCLQHFTVSMVMGLRTWALNFHFDQFHRC